jgi:hypothetical protein
MLMRPTRYENRPWERRLHSIPAPGTTGSRHRFISKEINLSVGSIGRLSVFVHRFQLERAEMFRQHGSHLLYVLRMGNELSQIREMLQCNRTQIAERLSKGRPSADCFQTDGLEPPTR